MKKELENLIFNLKYMNEEKEEKCEYCKNILKHIRDIVTAREEHGYYQVIKIYQCPICKCIEIKDI